MTTLYKHSIVAIVVFLSLVIGVKVASALTYSSDVDVQFTFNPTLQISLSSADLVISNLAPGTASDSNIINVNVKTNNSSGYTLNATVGNATTYNTRNLIHSLSGSSANFASVDYGASLVSLATDNTWAYSFSINNGTSWSTYSGLPLYSDGTNVATLRETNTASISDTGDDTNFKINAKASEAQPSGEYNNVINFVGVANPVVHYYLYDEVAKMSKGIQYTFGDYIQVPTTDSYLTDTSNSGVYQYLGPSSDAGSNFPIYYYRGILENSGYHDYTGESTTYPNYVRLGDTCWRIVRTTGSGGVKMAYNKESDLSGSTCINDHNSSYYTNDPHGPFNSENNYLSASYSYTPTINPSNIISVGYTYNPDIIAGSYYSTDTLFGSYDFPSLNRSSSVAKQEIEQWYGQNMADYTSLLEKSAGFCNDRTLYDGNNQRIYDDILPVSYGTNYYFGPYFRNVSYSESYPDLSCPRDGVDLYTTSSALDGNRQLLYPVALLTMDELVLAGAKWSGAGNSMYLDMNEYMTLSPAYYGGATSTSFLVFGDSGGVLYYTDSEHAGAFFIRPSISLVPGIEITGGTGTASDPWTVE